MFLQTGLGVLVGFSNRFRIFNFWFCKPSLCGLEIGTKLEWNLHKKILFYQKTSRMHQKNLELVKKNKSNPQKQSGACQKTNRTREKIWSLSKKQVEPTKKSGVCQKTNRTLEKRWSYSKNKSKPPNTACI